MTTSTRTNDTDILTAARNARAMIIEPARLVGGIMQHELVYKSVVVGEIRQSSTGDHIVMIDPCLGTSSNGKLLFRGSQQECLAWVAGTPIDGSGLPKLDCSQHADTFTTRATKMTTQTPAQMIASLPQFESMFVEFCLDYPNAKLYAAAEEIATVVALSELEPTKDNELQVSGVAFRKGVVGVWKAVQAFKNSEPYQDLLAEYETVSSEQLPVIKQAVVATGTTAKAIAEKAVSSEPLAVSKKESKPKTKKAAKAPTVLPMPAIANISELESLDRKQLIAATQALKSNCADVTLRANAASVDLKALLALHCLGVDYVAPAKAAKATKAAKVAEVLEMPVGLTFEGVKGMSYRELQKVAKALRSNGLFVGNVGGKGATKEALLSGICKGLGFNVVKLEMTAPSIKQLDAIAA